MNTKAELEIKLFENASDCGAWLKQHHSTSDGLWVRFAKKAASFESASYAEVLEIALCYGWIDGQVKTYDNDSWIRKFTPRRAKSMWSKINRDKALELIENGAMQEAGLREIELAKADGRWDAAYASASNMTVPDDFQVAIDASPKAKEFFEGIDRANRYAILFRVQTAKKPETRAKRIQQLIAMLEKGEKIH